MIKGDLESVLAQRCKDYVTVILTDKVDLDVIDMQDRLRLAFPGLLEIRRETVRQADYTRHADSERELNPFELCCQSSEMQMRKSRKFFRRLSIQYRR